MGTYTEMSLVKRFVKQYYWSSCFLIMGPCSAAQNKCHVNGARTGEERDKNFDKRLNSTALFTQNLLTAADLRRCVIT